MAWEGARGVAQVWRRRGPVNGGRCALRTGTPYQPTVEPGPNSAAPGKWAPYLSQQDFDAGVPSAFSGVSRLLSLDARVPTIWTP